jgi:branched-chain amino acid transport system substrate-binding protein
VQPKLRTKARLHPKRSRLLYGGVGFSVVALALAACSTSNSSGSSSGSSGSSSSSSGASSSEGSYDIGFTSGLTGQFGAVGQGVRDGAESYFDVVNKSGGINGHLIKFTALDDALDPNRGVANMIQLVTQDHVVGVIGFHDSVVADAVAPYAAKYKVPMIAATVDSTLVQPAQPYVYAVTVQTADYAAPQVEMAQQLMKNHKGPVRVAIITVSDSAGNQQWENGVTALVKSKGWDVVEDLITPQDAINAAPDVAKVIAAKPDVFIMALGTDPFLISAVKQIEQAGATFPIINYDFASWNALQSLQSKQLYDVAAIAYGTAAATPEFVTDTTAAGFSPNSIYVNKGFLEAMAITTALKACGYPCSGSQLEAQLNKLSVSTNGMIQGGMAYTATDHQSVTYMAGFQWLPGASAPVKVVSDLKTGT